MFCDCGFMDVLTSTNHQVVYESQKTQSILNDSRKARKYIQNH